MSALALACAPMPEAPAYPTTVNDPSHAPNERCAQTLQPVRDQLENAAHTSTGPACPLARATGFQDSPHPLTELKTAPAPPESLAR